MTFRLLRMALLGGERKKEGERESVRGSRKSTPFGLLI